jgi:ribosomal protein L29
MKKNADRTIELSKKSRKELYSELTQKKYELAHIRIAISTQKEKKVNKVKLLKSDIARILTIIRSTNEQ